MAALGLSGVVGLRAYTHSLLGDEYLRARSVLIEARTKSFLSGRVQIELPHGEVVVFDEGKTEESEIIFENDTGSLTLHISKNGRIF
jgi:hypothetical protein